jgi:transketolase
MTKTISERAADNIRILSAAMVEQARSGHPGGPMGGADFITVLFSEFLRFDPEDMTWPLRDRFFLDPGHLSAALYSVLSLFGLYTIDELKQFRQWGSPCPGHPEYNPSRGIENTSGPLGLGHAMAVGAALAERFLTARFGDWMEHRIYAYVSDGGIQEEISQGAGRIAGFLGLNNLILFFDSNEVQLSTRTCEVTLEDTAAKYRAWGWHVMTIDGHDHDQIREALRNGRREKSRPVLIIGRTVMGKGALTEAGENFEGRCETHGQPLTKAGVSLERTISNLGGDPGDPFASFPDVASYCKKIRKRKILEARSRKQHQRQWEEQNPSLAARLKDFLDGVMPAIIPEDLQLKAGMATRAASGKVLEYLGEHLPNMIVISADLSNSDKTEGFLRHTRPFSNGDFSGNFLHAGVSELTMAALAGGIALHGGIRVACGTFFAFSDYMKPAIRLTCLMGLPVIYIWSHDSFRVGEDGPTHQPVEQEAQIRLMEQVKNHAGHNSMLVLRPADAWETLTAWEMALGNSVTPTALILSRQGVGEIPAREGSSRYLEAQQVRRGAYCIIENSRPDILLIANGSEVATLYEAAMDLMNRQKLRVQLVSVPSVGLFRNQDITYQHQVFPAGVPVFGLTAGLPAVLSALGGEHSKIMGLDHFGYSAPAQVLDEKFGFTPTQVIDHIAAYLNNFRKVHKE